MGFGELGDRAAHGIAEIGPENFLFAVVGGVGPLSLLLSDQDDNKPRQVSGQEQTRIPPERGSQAFAERNRPAFRAFPS